MIRFSTISAPLFTEIDGLEFLRGRWTRVDVDLLSDEQLAQLVKYTGRILGVHPDDEDDYADLIAPPPAVAAPPAELAPVPSLPAVASVEPAARPPGAAAETDTAAPAAAVAEPAPPPIAVAVAGDTGAGAAPPPASAAVERPEKPRRR